MSWVQKISLRFDEMLHHPSGNGTATLDAPSASPSSTNRTSAKKRARHPKEASPIRKNDYGKFKFRFDNPEDSFITDEGDPFVFSDLYTHGIIFGESGSGKTSFVLNQIFEEMFRSTNLPDGPDREKLKLGGLIVEAKGDFAAKTWDLSVKYGRTDDVILFGPSHVNHVYDPFGDESESPQQLADKMQAVMDSFSGGQKAADPFWPAASRKLFTQIFYLYRKLKAVQTPELPPMSFELLNLLLMDRGQPRNQGEIEAKARQFQEVYEKFNQELAKSRAAAIRLAVDLGALGEKTDYAMARDHAALQALQLEMQAHPHPTPEIAADFDQRLKALQQQANASDGLHKLLSCAELGKASEKLVVRLERLKKDISGIGTAPDDNERGAFYDSIIENSQQLRKIIHARAGSIALAGHVEKVENLLLMRSMLMDLIDALERVEEIGNQLAEWQAPTPQTGMLKRLLTQYEEVVRKEGGDPAIDPICAYFYEEYLNPANDKTSGSVAMTASNVVNMFIHPPFNKIFSPAATFSMGDIIDKGYLLAMDMPQAKFGVVFNIAALIMKVDFFRAVLSRKATTLLDPGSEKPRPINQDRPLTYMCDEFASIATTGDTTGEAGFLDKCREYKCACLLAVQSKPMLLKKLQESEVDAILTNCGIKIFLRNTDEKTTEMASKVLGSEIKIQAHNQSSTLEMGFNMSKPYGHTGVSTSYQRSPRFDPSKFSKLKNGEAIVRLNPRFGTQQAKKVAFSLHILKTIDSEGLLPFPIVTA